MPQVISSSDVDSLVTEWLMYQIDSRIKPPRNVTVKASSLLRKRDKESNKMLKNLCATEDVDEFFGDSLLDQTVEVPMRIGEYWYQIMNVLNESGGLKYLNPTKLVKAALVLSHGNAQIE